MAHLRGLQRRGRGAVVHHNHAARLFVRTEFAAAGEMGGTNRNDPARCCDCCWFGDLESAQPSEEVVFPVPGLNEDCDWSKSHYHRITRDEIPCANPSLAKSTELIAQS